MAKLIKIAIVEDEDAAVNRLKKELSRLDEFSFEIVATCKSISETVEWLGSPSNVDLIFLDIQLTDGSSFEIFNQIDVPCPVIFTTAYDEFALKAFKVNSVDYLLKPIDPNDLETAIKQYLKQKISNDESSIMHRIQEVARELRPSEYRSSFLVSYRHKMKMINVVDVAYLYIKERAVFLMMKDGQEYLIEFFLDDLEKQLNPVQFYRANRQFLVSRSSIFEIEPYFNGRLILLVKPEAYTSVIVSKEKATHFKRWADY